MKRDPDLMREILLDTENPQAGMQLYKKWKPEVLSYHFRLSIQGGLITSSITGTYDLTTKGHEWCDAIRDETIWNAAKSLMEEKIGNVVLEMMPGICIKLSNQVLEHQEGTK